MIYKIGCGLLCWMLFSLPLVCAGAKAEGGNLSQREAATVLIGYFNGMVTPKPFVVRSGDEFLTRQESLRQHVLATASLWPLPERIPLDVHESSSLDHPWCTVRRVYYQLWPDVYSSGLLYLPKTFSENPAPAVLCPHGHWQYGNADPREQTRSLVLAQLGYVVFAPNQNHYEDVNLGVSHQTLMIWTNMRALDYLQSLPYVNPERIGVAGISGGGLQTQMIAGLDSRVRAASIAGLTCDYREILFPHAWHCGCNHWPGIMLHTDWPEISALGLPTAVQYLTMQDWTGHFIRDNMPTVSDLYGANGVPNRIMAEFWNTGHVYDQPKREYVYWWMNKWLRNDTAPVPPSEPSTVTFDPSALLNLQTQVANDRGFGEISGIYRRDHGYQRPLISSVEEWESYREEMLAVLPPLLGDSAELPPESDQVESLGVIVEDGLEVQRLNLPSEGNVAIPTVVLYSLAKVSTRHVIVMCAGNGKEYLLAENGPNSPRSLAHAGALVVLPDVRFIGDLRLTNITGYVLGAHSLLSFMPYNIWDTNPSEQEYVSYWDRNAITWGRPLPAMMATDLRDVLDGVLSYYAVEPERVELITRGSWPLAAAGLFAAVRDTRITHVDLDLQGGSFNNQSQPTIPFVLQHGDVIEWASLLAQRNLRLRNNSGDTSWLEDIFAVLGNTEGFGDPLPDDQDVDVDGYYKADWMTTNLPWRGGEGECFWWANAGLDGYYPGVPDPLQGGWDGHPWVVDAATNSLHLVVPAARNTYGQGISNIGGTRADWSPAHPVHFPFIVSFKVKPSEWVMNLNIICNLMIDPEADGGYGIVQTFSPGGYDGLRCTNASAGTAAMAVVNNGNLETFNVGNFSGNALLGVRFECTNYSWRLAYDAGDTGTWNYPNGDASFRPYHGFQTYSPEARVGFYARGWTFDSNSIGDVNIHLYDLTMRAEQADLPECCLTGGEGEGRFSILPRGGWFEEGDTLSLTAALADPVGSVTYRWMKDGGDILGATQGTYEKVLTLADSGLYQCEVTDASKAVFLTPAASVIVFEPGSLPVAGFIGLGAVLAMLSGSAITAIRRKEA